MLYILILKKDLLERVISYNNYIKFESEQACRENGKLNIEGKDYVVNDGDIMHFRFNVNRFICKYVEKIVNNENVLS